jgi:hypothetical protein
MRGLIDYLLTPSRLPFIALLLLLGFALAIVANASMARFAVTDAIGESLPFGTVLRLVRAEPATWIVAALVGFAIAIAPGRLVGLADLEGFPGLAFGWIVRGLTGGYILLVRFHLIGQAYHRAAQTITRDDAGHIYRWVPPQTP